MSKVMTQTKRDTLVLQVGGWAWGWRPSPPPLGKGICVQEISEMSRTGLTNRRRPGCKEKELIFGTWNVRPRNRWADVVHRDALQLLGIRGWRRRNGNRDEWRRLVREAKARKGLWRHLRMGIRHIYIYIYVVYLLNVSAILVGILREVN